MHGLILTVLAFVVPFTLSPNFVTKPGSIEVLTQSGTQGLGWTLLLASLVWIAVAQARLGELKLTIDRGTSPALVRKGPFSLTQPIFWGTRLTPLGWFLVVLKAVTLTILVIRELVIQIQVRVEETHLSEAQAQADKQYLTASSPLAVGRALKTQRSPHVGPAFERNCFYPSTAQFIPEMRCPVRVIMA